MSKNSTIVMLQMMATMLSEPELIDRAIEALTEYKEKGCPKDDQPFPAVTMVLIKWQQEDKTIEDVVKDALLKNKVFDKMQDEMDKEEKTLKDGEEEEEEDELHFKTVGKDKNSNKIRIQVIPMGGGGEA